MKFFSYSLLASCLLLFSSITAGQAGEYTKINTNGLRNSDNGSSVMLGYCDKEFVNGQGLLMPGEIQAAIYITPEQAALYKGNRVTGVNVGLFNTASDFSIFIAEELGAKAVSEQVVGNGEKGWNKVTLDNPYTITDEGFYIGYKCTGSRPIAMSNKYSEHGAWIAVRALDTGEWVWGNWAIIGVNIKSWCLQAIVEGDNMPNDLNLWEVGRCSVKTGESFILEGIVESMTTFPVANYEISYSIDNGDPVVHTIETSMQANDLDTFRIEVPGIDKVGKFPLQVSVSKINGEDDVYAVNSTLQDLVYCRTDIFDRNVVVEEGTATWEEYAPLGIVGLREMKKKYPDTFIGIAIHVGDEMEESIYQGLVSDYFEAEYPNCVVDRKTDYVQEPSFENLEKIYLAERALTADAEIKITSAEFSSDSTTVHIATEARFSYPETKTDYRIAFVVLENGVTGYSQTNIYAGGENGEMGGFETLPYKASIEFDNVARGIYRDYIGTLNCFPPTIVNGETYTYSYDLKLPATIQRKKNTEFAVLLIDGKTKEIMNADKIKIVDDGSNIGQTPIAPELYIYAEDGRIKVEGEYDTLQIYTTDGIEVSDTRLRCGIYMVKVTVGNHISVRKVVLQ